MGNLINRIKLCQEARERIEKTLQELYKEVDKHKNTIYNTKLQLEPITDRIKRLQEKLNDLENTTDWEVFNIIANETIRQFLIHKVNETDNGHWRVFGIITPHDYSKSILREGYHTNTLKMHSIIKALFPIVTEFNNTINFDFVDEEYGCYDTTIYCKGLGSINISERFRNNRWEYLKED